VRHVCDMFRVNWNLHTNPAARAPQGASSGYPGGTLKGSRLAKHETLMFLPESRRERVERAYYLRDTAHVIHFNPSRRTQADNSRGITETRWLTVHNCLIHRPTDVSRPVCVRMFIRQSRALMPPPGYPWVVRHALEKLHQV